MSRKKSAAPFSLFAFQDAITSVCGVVVLITLLLALSLAKRVMSEAETTEVAKSKVDEVRSKVEELRSNLEELDARVDESLDPETLGVGLSVSEVKARLANARRRLDDAREESERLEELLESLKEKEKTFPELEARVEEIRRKIEETLNRARETAEEVFDSQRSAVYAFSDSVREKPWYVEVAGSKIVAHGSTNDTEAKTFDSPFAFTKWATTRPAGSEYFVLIVRPSGAKNFDFIVFELEEASYRYGIDLIGEDKPLMFLNEREKGGGT